MLAILLAFLLVPALPQDRLLTIQGMVVRAETTDAIRGASVSLSAARGPSVMATTDDSGNFIFRDVAPGTYRISAAAGGYIRGEYSHRGQGRPGTPVTVAPGQDTGDLVIGLTPASAISGRTYTPEGNPIAYATVQLMRHLYIEGRRMLTVWKQGRTNEMGEYRFDGLHPAQYIVSAIPPERGAGTAVSRPIPAMQLENGETYLPVYFPGTLDVDGLAAIDLLPGVDHTGLNLTLTPQRGLRIRGHIDGATGSTVMATLSRREARNAIAGSTAPRGMRLALDGAFQLEGIAPGFYDLIVIQGDGPARTFARTTVAVDRDIDDVRLVLQPSFELRGRVILDEAGGGDVVFASNSVRIELVHEPYIAQVAPPGVNVAPDGSFVFRGMIPGTYHIRAGTAFHSYISEARLGSADLLDASYVDETAGDIVHVRLNLHVGSLDVSVFDEQNAPASTVQAVLAPDYPKRQRLDLYQSRLTDERGHARFDYIEPGNYKVFVWESVESGGWKDSDFIRRYEDLGTAVRIGEDARASVTLRVIRVRR